MKIRIKGNSIRFRVTQTEVAQLAAGAALRDTTEFAPGRQLTWVLESSACVEMESSLDGATVSVRLPASAVGDWARTDSEGLYGRSGALDISVEKDFRCLHRAGSPDDVDAFPRPN